VPIFWKYSAGSNLLSHLGSIKRNLKKIMVIEEDFAKLNGDVSTIKAAAA
jgi:hypothetical protein